MTALAAKSGISKSPLSRLENGLEPLLPLAAAFHLPLTSSSARPRLVIRGSVWRARPQRPAGLPADWPVELDGAVWKVVIPPERERPREAAEFDTRLPHWLGPTGDQPVEILSVRGERMRIRAAAPHPREPA